MHGERERNAQARILDRAAGQGKRDPRARRHPAAKPIRITAAPAKVLGVPAGRVEVGAPADICVFDPRAHWRVEPRALKSQGHNSPFLGYELPATVRATLVAGQVAFERH